MVEAAAELDFPAAEKIGMTVPNPDVVFNGEKFAVDDLQKINSRRFCSVYPDRGIEGGTTRASMPERREVKYGGKPVDEVKVYIPVFSGTNCDYDTAKAFERAGAHVSTSVFCDLTADDIFASIDTMKRMIDECHIFVLSGGFSAGDEPDGSGKFIANVLNNRKITDAIHALLDRGGLILGICNGFQALVKSGLLPYGRLGCVGKESPTLFRNDINSVAVSHGEGKFVVSDEMAEELFRNGQVAFQYVDPAGYATLCAPYNPNGSSYAIEGIISRDGHILGKMGHTERYEEGLFKNIAGNKVQEIFANAVNYFKGI